MQTVQFKLIGRIARFFNCSSIDMKTIQVFHFVLSLLKIEVT